MFGQNHPHPRSGVGLEGDCMRCGSKPVPYPGEMCAACGVDNPDHVKNGWYDTWSPERQEAYDDEFPF